MVSKGVESSVIVSVYPTVSFAPCIDMALGEEVLNKVITRNFSELAHGEGVLGAIKKDLKVRTSKVIEDILDLLEETGKEDCLKEIGNWEGTKDGKNM